MRVFEAVLHYAKVRFGELSVERIVASEIEGTTSRAPHPGFHAA